MASRRSGWLAPANVGLAVLAVIVVVVSIAAVRRTSSGSQTVGPATPPTSSPSAAPGVRAAIIGDSYFAARPDYSPPVADRVGRAMGWNYLNLAIGGTGYLQPGYAGQNEGTYLDRVPQAIQQGAKVVVVEGGGNDYKFSLARQRAAIVRTLTALRKGLPAAKVVVLGPLWSGENDGLQQRMDAMYKQATSQVPGVLWINPAGWFPGTFLATSGPGRQYISADHTHPNEQGARFLTRKVVAALRSAGIS